MSLRIKFLISLVPCMALMPLGRFSHAATWTTLIVNPDSYTSGSVTSKGYSYFKFASSSGYHYSVCVNTTAGDADLYASTAANVSTGSYGARSRNSGLEDDCIQYTSSASGTLYIAVYGYKSSTFRVYSIGHKLANVPSYLSGKLACPIDDGAFGPTLCGKFTSAFYGPFGSPWGNAEDGPFFAAHQNYFHNGIDYLAPAGKPVIAAYSGVVKRTGSAGTADDGNGWGKYVVVEHDVSGNKFTTAYIHLADDSYIPSVGASVSRRQRIGTIFDLKVTGEAPHLHFTLHTGAARTSSPTSQGGAMKFTDWKSYGSVFINADVTTNPGLYAN